MTSERRIIVSLADIRPVTCECKKCHYRVSLQPDDSRHMVPDTCPGRCSQLWWEHPGAELRRGEVAGVVADFMADLREMRKPKQAFGFLLLFEFDEPAPASEA